MANKGPIVIIDDDVDDIDILTMTIKELEFENSIIAIERSTDVIPYLKTLIVQPFIIFCDLNMPIKNGITLKREIDNDELLRKKSIPFVFYTTSAHPVKVAEAYAELTIQGFFEKGDTMQSIRDTVYSILKYWKFCKHPNSALLP